MHLPLEMVKMFTVKLTIIRVCDAWPKMFPPTGFFGSATKVIPAPGSAVIWLVI